MGAVVGIAGDFEHRAEADSRFLDLAGTKDDFGYQVWQARIGIAQGGGSGKYLAQWMLHGDADINMTEFDPRRYGSFATIDYTRAKVFLDYRKIGRAHV